ncbi:MAG: hypothetical protein CXR31_13855 [Geobacter sp.]|nr:MAG: hypothetical protein CXR31_13855 [Geobacter sp.]
MVEQGLQVPQQVVVEKVPVRQQMELLVALQPVEQVLVMAVMAVMVELSLVLAVLVVLVLHLAAAVAAAELETLVIELVVRVEQARFVSRILPTAQLQ